MDIAEGWLVWNQFKLMKKIHWKLHFSGINQIKITSLLFTILFTTRFWSRRDYFWGLLLFRKMTSVKFLIEWCVYDWYLGDLLFLVTLWRPTFRPLTKSFYCAQTTRAKVCNFWNMFFVGQGMTFGKKKPFVLILPTPSHYLSWTSVWRDEVTPYGKETSPPLVDCNALQMFIKYNSCAFHLTWYLAVFYDWYLNNFQRININVVIT